MGLGFGFLYARMLFYIATLCLAPKKQLGACDQFLPAFVSLEL